MRPGLLTTVEWVARSSVRAWAQRAGWTRTPGGPIATEPHLTAAIDWLARAQDAASDGGGSDAFVLLRGWRPADASGSAGLVPTLYDAALVLERPDLNARAERLARFALAGGEPTANAVLGLLRAWKETALVDFSGGAIRAGDALVAAIDAPVTTAERARTAWALLQLAKATSEFSFYEAARALIDRVVATQNGDGWFVDNASDGGEVASTEAIGIVAQALIEAYAHTGDDRCWVAGERATDRLVDKLVRGGFVAARQGAAFSDAARSESVAGVVLAGITALRMFHLRGDRRHFDRGLAVIAHVKQLVDTEHRHPGVRGAIPAAWPIYGTGARLQFRRDDNKRWVDALMLAEALTRRHDKVPLHGAAIVLKDRYSS